MYSKTYQELLQMLTLNDRFEYLSLRGSVGDSTFGHERWLNQGFYQSGEWRRVRHHVIARDNGCDLGLPGYEIFDRPIVHHINPLTAEDIESGSPALFDLNNLITVSHETHNAIHYGTAALLRQPFVERSAGDTKLW